MIAYTTPPSVSSRFFGVNLKSIDVKEHVHAVDLDVVDRWLDAGEDAVRSELLKGGSMQRIALLTGSKTIIESLKSDIHGPKFEATINAPRTVYKEKVVAPNLDFMAALDGEMLADHLVRVREEAEHRGLVDVVGMVNSIQHHVEQGFFNTDVPVATTKKTKVYVVPERNGNLKWDEAKNLIAKESAREKYDAIYAAVERCGTCTDDELRGELRESARGMVPGTVTAYRGDLARAGWVRYTGEHRKGESGSSMKVWEIAP